MFYVTSGCYQIGFDDNTSDFVVNPYRQHARVFREYQPSVEESTQKCLVAISDLSEKWPGWPDLALVLPRGHGFSGGCLVVPETKICFIGSLDVLVAYRLDTFEEIWEDMTKYGCLGWNRSGNHVLMSGEIELAAWDIHGHKRWTASVEPPWDFHVKDGIVHLNVMDKLSSFPLDTGPTQ